MQTAFTVSPVDEKIVAKLGLVILLPAASGAVRHIQLTSSMRSTCRSLNSAQTDSAFAPCVCGARKLSCSFCAYVRSVSQQLQLLR
ncbi:hypothetical protein C8R45DRAFT_1000792 [Mycena sanguinolenta]|nr:hypothetical protein C8R45DRAFT_1000792 [Mycena sanguinolenta]